MIAARCTRPTSIWTPTRRPTCAACSRRGARAARLGPRAADRPRRGERRGRAGAARPRRRLPTRRRLGGAARPRRSRRRRATRPRTPRRARCATATSTCSARSSARRPGRCRRAGPGSRASSETSLETRARRRPRDARDRAAAVRAPPRRQRRARRRAGRAAAARPAGPQGLHRGDDRKPARRAASAGPGGVQPGDQPINVEAAEFRADGRLLLGLRYPVTADGHPLLVEIHDVESLFADPDALPRAGAVWWLENVGSAAAPVGFRGLDTHGDDRFDAIVGDLDAANKSATVLEDHPEGGRAASEHVRFALPGDGAAPRPPRSSTTSATSAASRASRSTTRATRTTSSTRRATWPSGRSSSNELELLRHPPRPIRAGEQRGGDPLALRERPALLGVGGARRADRARHFAHAREDVLMRRGDQPGFHDGATLDEHPSAVNRKQRDLR